MTREKFLKTADAIGAVCQIVAKLELEAFIRALEDNQIVPNSSTTDFQLQVGLRALALRDLACGLEAMQYRCRLFTGYGLGVLPVGPTGADPKTPATKPDAEKLRAEGEPDADLTTDERNALL